MRTPRLASRACETRARVPIPPKPITSLNSRSRAIRRTARVLRAPTSHRRSASARAADAVTRRRGRCRRHGHVTSADWASVSGGVRRLFEERCATARRAHERLASRPRVTPSPERARARPHERCTIPRSLTLCQAPDELARLDRRIRRLRFLHGVPRVRVGRWRDPQARLVLPRSSSRSSLCSPSRSPSRSSSCYTTRSLSSPRPPLAGQEAVHTASACHEARTHAAGLSAKARAFAPRTERSRSARARVHTHEHEHEPMALVRCLVLVRSCAVRYIVCYRARLSL